MRKQFISIISGLVLLTVSFLPFFDSAPAVAQARDCDANAIVRCGAYSVAELQQKMTGDVPAIFGHYGISPSQFGGLSEGIVYRDGRVTVGGKVVANGAVSTGRHFMAGSRKVTVGKSTIYERSVGTSFRSSSIPAFVKMTNGRFQYAIIKSCGNPTKASPVAPPPAPKPTPTPPAPTPKIDIQKDVDKATVSVNEQFNYTVKVTNIGAVDITKAHIYDKAPTNIQFIPGSGSAGTTVTTNEFKTTIANLPKGMYKSFTFKAKFTAYTSSPVKNEACVLAEGPSPSSDCDTAENQPKKPPVVIKDNCPIPGKEDLPKNSPDCKEEPKECKPGIPEGDERCEEKPITPPPVEITPPPVQPEPIPVTPAISTTPVVVNEIPATGPEQIVGGSLGLGSLTYGALGFIKSRRHLRDLLMKK